VFEVGFSELLLVAIIGLVVLGPERLPTAVRTTSLWIGRLRRQFNQIRTEVENELGVQEIRRQLHNDSIMDELRESRAIVQEAARDVESSLKDSSSSPSATEPDKTGV
jgi:sec-independent protein translocase protein TatB